MVERANGRLRGARNPACSAGRVHLTRPTVASRPAGAHSGPTGRPNGGLRPGDALPDAPRPKERNALALRPAGAGAEGSPSVPAALLLCHPWHMPGPIGRPTRHQPRSGLAPWIAAASVARRRPCVAHGEGDTCNAAITVGDPVDDRTARHRSPPTDDRSPRWPDTAAVRHTPCTIPATTWTTPRAGGGQHLHGGHPMPQTHVRALPKVPS